MPVQAQAVPQEPVPQKSVPQEADHQEPVPQEPVPVQVSTAVQTTSPEEPGPPTVVTDISDRDEELASLPSERITTRIPRAGFSRNFRRMKTFLFRKTPSPEVHTRIIRSNPESLQASPER